LIRKNTCVTGREASAANSNTCLSGEGLPLGMDDGEVFTPGT